MPFREIKATIQQQVIELQNVKFKGNPSLPSEESDTDPDMEETRATGGNHPLTKLEVLMQKMEWMELQASAGDAETLALRKELQTVKQKEESKAYAQTWENNATLETHDPIARVTGMLEQNKKTDETQGYPEMLCGELRKENTRIYPKYDGNPEKVFEWCKNLEKTHLNNHVWETIPEQDSEKDAVVMHHCSSQAGNSNVASYRTSL